MPLQNLFNPATYAGCRVTSPDLRTLVVDGVRGTSLRVVFRQHVEHWQVRISATGHFTDRPEPNHAPLGSGIRVTPEITGFWNWLADLRFENESNELDDRIREAYALIEGSPANPPAAKSPS